MALISETLLAVRSSPRIHKLPPYVSLICILAGIAWLLLLPLDEYSRRTYISENALLPGQVHAYFGGSEQQIFNAYRHEVLAVQGKGQDEISAKLIEIFKSQGLKTATQKYEYTAAGQKFSGENVYAILQAPRGDATEAMALVAPWVNMEGDLNTSGVALALTLGRYFKRWSLWSKDIIFLLTPDAISGPHAFVSAYHSSDAPTANANVSALPLKSGALQGAIVVDNPLNHKFHSIHMQYDGMNGQLPNLDLINTARHNANDQCGMPTSIQGMSLSNQGSYDVKLQTMLKGMVRQGLGHASGAHSAFVPYQISAITVTATGEGREDDMAMGRYIESLFRSINNLMEKFHQSFFFYLLLGPERFVSIGTYLPSAMAIAAAFTIMALAGWIASGRMPTEDKETKAPEAVAAPAPVTPGKKGKAAKLQAARLEAAKVEMMVVKSGEDTALVPAVEVEVQERKLLLPVLSVLLIHFFGIVPLWLFNNLYYDSIKPTFRIFAIANVFLPSFLRETLQQTLKPTGQQLLLMKSFSLLMLGVFLATLATLNFSLSFGVGLVCVPLIFVPPYPVVDSTNSVVPTRAPVPATSKDAKGEEKGVKDEVARNTNAVFGALLLHLLSPPVLLYLVCWATGLKSEQILAEAAFGWAVGGLWTQVIVWCVWWPAWIIGVGLCLG